MQQLDSWELLLYLNKRRDDLNKALTIAKERGIELAEAERKYRVEKRKAILQAKHNGEKVSLIMELVNVMKLLVNYDMNGM